MDQHIGDVTAIVEPRRTPVVHSLRSSAGCRCSNGYASRLRIIDDEFRTDAGGCREVPAGGGEGPSLLSAGSAERPPRGTERAVGPPASASDSNLVMRTRIHLPDHSQK